MTFGERIKSARISKNLTQRQLADMINSKHNSVSDWENDKSKPDVDTLELICGVLEITPNYILDSQTEKEYKNMTEMLIYNPQLFKMVKNYIELSNDDQKAIQQIINSILKGRE